MQKCPAFSLPLNIRTWPPPSFFGPIPPSLRRPRPPCTVLLAVYVIPSPRVEDRADSLISPPRGDASGPSLASVCNHIFVPTPRHWMAASFLSEHPPPSPLHSPRGT